MTKKISSRQRFHSEKIGSSSSNDHSSSFQELGLPARGRGPAKKFRCTGHGDCHMEFTRSEHLARHQRKHTGEKPFKCVVEGCDRMFSRFDNMMQHTHTHNKGRAASRRGKSKKMVRRNMSSSFIFKATSRARKRRDHDDEDDDDDEDDSDESQEIVHANDDEDDDEDDDEENQQSDASYRPSVRANKKQRTGKAQGMMMHWGQCNPGAIASPEISENGNSSSSSIDSSTGTYHSNYSMNNNNDNPGMDSASNSSASPGNNLILPRLASFLVSHQELPPENFLVHRPSEEEAPIRRRLSIRDLCNPIDWFSDQQVHEAQEEGSHLTHDEIEALQGFGRLMTFQRS